MQKLAILLPIKGSSLAAAAQRLQAVGRGLACSPPGGDRSSAAAPRLFVCLGIDADDEVLAGAAGELCACFPAAEAVAVCTFGAAELSVQRERCGGAAPLCWMWNELALHAQRTFEPDWTLLLGDDTAVEPAGWPTLLAGTLPRGPPMAAALCAAWVVTLNRSPAANNQPLSPTVVPSCLQSMLPRTRSSVAWPCWMPQTRASLRSRP